ASVFDHLNGSTLGTVQGSEDYTSGGPFGQQAFVGDGSSGINYGSVAVPATGSLAIRVRYTSDGQRVASCIRESYTIRRSNSGNLQTIMRQSGSFVTLSMSSSLDTWYHVVLTNDGTTHRMYVNGSLQDSA